MIGRLLDTLLATYQAVLSPHLGAHCRFHPTCSAYAREALGEHGAACGSWLALKRIARCQPFATAGLDPVPKKNDA